MSIPFVMGCDLNSNPSMAAYKILMGLDCQNGHYSWLRPEQTSEDYSAHYKAISSQFKQLQQKKKLLPLLNTLKSAYKDITYSHGQHTSRTATCYSDACSGMFDHIVFNDSHLKVLNILEIPEERSLAPSTSIKGADMDGTMNYVTKLPNSVFPSDHLRLEVEFQLIPQPATESK